MHNAQMYISFKTYVYSNLVGSRSLSFSCHDFLDLSHQRRIVDVDLQFIDLLFPVAMNDGDGGNIQGLPRCVALHLVCDAGLVVYAVSDDVCSFERIMIRELVGVRLRATHHSG